MRQPRGLVRVLVAAGMVLVGWVTVHPGPSASAASLSFMVNSTADTHDALPGDGVCVDTSSQCTLRAAIEEANARPSGSAISVTVPAGTYGLTLGELALTANTISIQGAGAPSTVVTAFHRNRVLTVGAGVRATLGGVTIAGGHVVNENGGGITNAGSLVVVASRLISNTAEMVNFAGGGAGGGLDNTGSMTITYSVLSGNSASYGGGLYNDNGTVTVATSTLNDNSATAGGGLYSSEGTLIVDSSTLSSNSADTGGGLYNWNLSTATVVKSTFSGNSASYGGGLYNAGTVTVATSTLSGNSAGTGGGIDNNNGTLIVHTSTLSGNSADFGGGLYNGFSHSTIVLLSYVTVAANSTGLSGNGLDLHVAGTLLANSTAGPNCGGPLIETQGYNLDSDGSCGLTRPTDITNTNPLLGPLANNGGPTQTMAFPPGSPAVDHGGTTANGCRAADQRGISRPQGPACDIGAYELVQ